MTSIYKLAKDMGVCHHTMRRWLRLGRIPGVEPPPPKNSGVWHYLTLRDQELIRTWYGERMVLPGATR